MEVIKQNNKNESYKEFESLLSEDLNNRPFREGEIVEGTITRIEDKYCFISLNLKSEGVVAIDEFALTKELDLVKVGAKVKVLIEKLEDFSGNLVISREAARKVSSWKRVEKSFHEKKEARGYIISRCKSGWVCDIGGVLAFLPNSQVDLKPLSNIDHLIKQEQVFEVVKLDKRRGNIVVSRRAILEKQRNKNKDELLSKIKVGDIVEGVVKGIVDWGVFLDLNGVDALLHITDISWSRVNKPSELVELSSVLKVKVTKIDYTSKKISVSLKDLQDDPYINKINDFKIGEHYPAVITKCTTYGAFARIADGLEGLIHNTELHWSKKNLLAKNILSTSQNITVEVLSIQKDVRKISLSYRRTQPNPWKKLASEKPVGTVVDATVRSVSDFAIFVRIKDTELDGMIHYKDLNYDEDVENLKKWKKVTL